MTCDFRRFRVTAVAALSTVLLSPLLFSPRAARALTFIFNAQSGTSQQAIDGFNTAGNLWSSYFSDNVTINITIGFRSLGGSILAQANSTSSVFSYSAVRSALISDATSLLDATAVSNLQNGPALQFVTNTTTGAAVLDNDGSNNNRFLDMTSANAKALGLIAATNTAEDAFIEFNSDFTYDFNRSDGILGSSYDFVGLAAHEIGHSLGFISGVDTVDYYSGPRLGGTQPLDLNGYAVFNTLDLYRYSSATNTQVAGFGKVQDLTQGAAAYFSVDGGATTLGFSTGPYDGDGRQASHWKDSQGLGIMDPTAGGGELLTISGNDLAAFDAIGWNLASVEIPEPSTLPLIGGAAFTVGGIRGLRRRRRIS